MWASGGFLVAGFWALYATATFPSTNERMRDACTLICITCPIAMAGMHHPLGLYQSLVANAVTYGCMGLVVEGLRKRVRHAQQFKHSTPDHQSSHPNAVKSAFWQVMSDIACYQ